MSIAILTGLGFALGTALFFVGLDLSRSRAVSAAPFQNGYNAAPVAPPMSLRDRIDALFEEREVRTREAKPGKLTLAEQLSRADLRLRTSEWMGIRIGAAILLAAIGFVRFGLGPQFIVLAVIGYFAPRFYLGYRQSKRLKAFNDQLGDTLILMSNALKTGYSIAQTIDVVANKSVPPMSQEFDRVVKEMNLGANIEDSLSRMVRRTDSSDLDMVVTAVAINRKIGGNLSEILENIAETIRERVRIKGDLRTLTAQARASGYLITGLPIVLGVFMYFVTPQYFAPMLGNPIGIGMLVVAGIFMGLGQLIMSRIATVDV